MYKILVVCMAQNFDTVLNGLLKNRSRLHYLSVAFHKILNGKGLMYYYKTSSNSPIISPIKIQISMP